MESYTSFYFNINTYKTSSLECYLASLWRNFITFRNEIHKSLYLITTIFSFLSCDFLAHIDQPLDTFSMGFLHVRSWLISNFCNIQIIILAILFFYFFQPTPQRPMTSDFEGFSIPDFMHYIYFQIGRAHV